MRRAGVVVSIVVLLAAGCGTDETPEVVPPSSIDVQAADYKFSAPDVMSSGPVEITLENEGAEPHQAQLFRLNQGVNAAQVIAAAKTDEGVVKLGTFAGGPNAVDADESQVTTTTVAPGRYVFMCLVPDAKGRPHASLGMVEPITVEQNDDAPPASDAAYTAATKDFDFELPEAWNKSITVTNKGKEPHEFQVMEIAEGKTEKDFLKSFQSEEAGSGPPPWTTGGGSAVITPGESDTFEPDLEPGTYFLMCFVESPKRKAPHFALGMLKKFEVK
jgi:uncharacterized cupredoxin-like copper-binding protein